MLCYFSHMNKATVKEARELQAGDIVHHYPTDLIVRYAKQISDKSVYIEFEGRRTAEIATPWATYSLITL